MMKKDIRKIGVLTSGGDAPGMNAAIRSVVRTALAEELEVYGIYDGYWGLYNDHIKSHIKKLDRYSVSDVLNRGGTFLGSARFPAFTQPAVRQQSIENLRTYGIEGLVVIGGAGSYQGAQALTEMGLPCIALPATIDNDVAGTDYAIGYFSALETVLRAIDQLRDTSSSHQRISIVEVMGRYCGDLTLAAAVAGGCEFIVIPEVIFDRHELVREIHAGIAKGKKHAIITITENTCDSHALATYIEQQTGRETRTTVLGHTQRGGPPVGYDRILASRLGSYAVELLQQGVFGHCVGLQREQLVHHDIAQTLEHMKRPFKYDWLAMAKKLF